MNAPSKSAPTFDSVSLAVKTKDVHAKYQVFLEKLDDLSYLAHEVVEALDYAPDLTEKTQKVFKDFLSVALVIQAANVLAPAFPRKLFADS